MREELAQHYQTINVFTAHFVSYGRTDDGSNVVLLAHIHLGEEWVADHVWVHRSKHMKQLELKVGDVVEFEARVGRYVKGIPRPHVEALNYDYNLEKIREFRVVQRCT